MATRKQTEAARKNLKKAQAKWKSMSPRQHAMAQPEGRKRAKPGAKGKGKYYRIVVRPKEEFSAFRYHDVGGPGHIQRLAGRRPSGSWSTQAWLISKEDAHMVNGKLVPDSSAARALLKKLGSKAKAVKGDVLKAKDRPNIPERKKPTAAQKRARAANIKKAQAARHRKTSRRTTSRRTSART